MKKKTLVILGTCFILMVAGVSYYSSYRGQGTSAPVVTTLTELPEQGNQRNSDMAGKQSVINNAMEAANVSADLKMSSAEYTERTNESKAYGIAPGAGSDSTGIYVHLCGAVRKPAVYRVEAGSRLVEVITLAEGLTETAAGDYINQAMLVKDGQRIYIPTKDEVEGLTPDEFIVGEDTAEKQEYKPQLIDINRADAGELMELPGIGKAKAESIIAYRNANGKFTAIEELMKVPGIKEGLFGQLVSYITVN